MANAIIGLAALALGAQTLPISYAEEMAPGMDINLSHGTYVCAPGNPQGVMNRLINIPDDFDRRQTAATLGCQFILADNNDHVFKVKKVVESVCLDREAHPGGMVLPDGTLYEGNIIACGREGHEVVIDRGLGVEQHVIVLTLDIDYD